MEKTLNYLSEEGRKMLSKLTQHGYSLKIERGSRQDFNYVEIIFNNINGIQECHQYISLDGDADTIDDVKSFERKIKNSFDLISKREEEEKTYSSLMEEFKEFTRER